MDMDKLQKTTTIIRIIFITIIIIILMLQLKGLIDSTTALTTAIVFATVTLVSIAFLQYKRDQKLQATITLISGFIIIVVSIVLINV
ncbi:hypothetical protein [Alkalicoccobacillus porphyridii]|uniref:Uncharacterized protein n=1 Tax=Alkalicoccobacillus porphyridii TaxID=2597270 RepID=A0A554A297_9BACI|nr:hypothetical protein [Alkalicoccobacillus porphyridii]TSB47805.1 hypothetical protein FN960_04625 [Alkalicoccobacillus porphyridii]